MKLIALGLSLLGLSLLLLSCGQDEAIEGLADNGSPSVDDASDEADDDQTPDGPSPRPASEYPATCEGRFEKLEDCGLLSPGPLRCEEPEGDVEECFMRCDLLASCNIMKSYFCSGVVSTPLERCYIECTAFECGNGNFVPSAFRCDAEDDCGDGSDEVDCTFFDCGDGVQLPTSWECDGEADCEDGSDEHSECELQQFVCVDSGERFPPSYECDDEVDCEDGSDEHADCAARIFECEAGGETFPESFECDGVEDCLDGSDEHDGCGHYICD